MNTPGIFIEQAVSRGRWEAARSDGVVFPDLIAWAVMFPAILYIWFCSNFQYALYWQLSVGFARLHNYCLIAAVGVLLFLGVQILIRDGLKVNRLFLVYVAVCTFYILANLGDNPASRYWMVQAIPVATGMLYVTATRKRLERFVWLNAGLGMLCVTLNSVPILSFYGMIDLPYAEVERVGGGLEGRLIPLRSYGLFGQTEAYIYPRLTAYRLQGWSSEPLHWSYFVLWAAVCCLLLISLSRWRWRYWILSPCLLLIGVHLLYVYSGTTFVVAGMSIATLVICLSLPSPRLKRIALFILFVFVAGLVCPVILALRPDMERWFYEEELLSKGTNWDTKLTYLKLRDRVLDRLWPDASFKGLTSHNLIFEMYLSFGIFFLVPLVWLEWEYLRALLRSSSWVLQVVASLSLAAANHQVPGYVFYPFGAMWLLITAAVVRFSHSSLRNPSLRCSH